jgi:hypothetical protein
VRDDDIRDADLGVELWTWQATRRSQAAGLRARASALAHPFESPIVYPNHRIDGSEHPLERLDRVSYRNEHPHPNINGISRPLGNAGARAGHW